MNVSGTVSQDMTENDILRPLLGLHPVVLAVIVWAWGYGSLLLAAIKTQSLRDLFTHPGFIVGDFFMLPIAAGLIAWFYHAVSDPVPSATHVVWTLGAGVSALVLTIVSVVRSGNVEVWWWPHTGFYWFMTYLVTAFMGKSLLQLVRGEEDYAMWALWLGVMLAIAVHLILPTIFGPKNLDQ